MYLPRNLISHLYLHLLRTHHSLSPPVLLLVALEPDALCACRILTALLKSDYIPHKIQPVSGHRDLARAGEFLVRPMRTCDGGSGGVVVCLGVGGLIDLEAALGLEVDENGQGGLGGINIWLFDARRPWNLANVFGGHGMDQNELSQSALAARKGQGVENGKILQSYRPGKGGITVYDDGDIDGDLATEREAYCSIEAMPEVPDGDISDDESDAGDNDHSKRNISVSSTLEAELDGQAPPPGAQLQRKRKSPSASDDDEDSEIEPENHRPKQRRKHDSKSSSPSPKQSKQPGLRKRLLRLRRKHEQVLVDYYAHGTSYSEPISSMLYSLASELGRDDNDLLWDAVVGVTSLDLYGKSSTGAGYDPVTADGRFTGWRTHRGERVHSLLRDEVRRLNPLGPKELAVESHNGDTQGVIPTHAQSATDMSIKLSPEPRFLLIRHWSLYESMLYSPYLSARLRMWSDNGTRRMHKLLAKMGVSLAQSKQSYVHMDVGVKRGLRERLLKYAPIYGLDGLLPAPSHRGSNREGWGFVRFWGWKACLSALDVGIVIGALLEIGPTDEKAKLRESSTADNRGPTGRNASKEGPQSVTTSEQAAQDQVITRFWAAYDALSSIDLLTAQISAAQHLHRAILRTGSSLMMKKQIHHLRAFRIAVVKEGPDVQLFTHPGALIKLALWIQEALNEMEGLQKSGKGGELVVACLDEGRGLYIVVGLGGGGVSPDASKQRLDGKAEKKERARKVREERAAKRRDARLRSKLEKENAAGTSSASNDGTQSPTDSEDESVATETESDSSSVDGDDAPSKKLRRSRFGHAFQEAVQETGAQHRFDSFDHYIIEVRKEDLGSFLESLSMKSVVG